MKLHYKLFLTFGLITALAMVSIFIYLDKNLNDKYILQLKDNIKKQAQTTIYILSKNSEEKNTDALIQNIGNKLGLRITLIDNKGVVISDSEIKHDKVIKLENHLERSEIQSAIQLGEGWSQRFSTTLKKDVLYYAAPLYYKDFKGFIRLSIPVDKISLVFNNMEGVLFVSLFVVFIATLLVALISFRFISSPIRTLSKRAKEIASGDFSKKILHSNNDEVGELAESLNIMTQNIVSRINEIHNNNSKFEAVLLSMFDGVIVLDSNGAIQLINKTMKDVLQISDKPLGKKPIEIIRNLTIQNIAESVLKMDEGVITKEENLVFPYNKIMLIHATPVVRDNKTLGAVIVFNDITELRRLETIRRDFVANVSHELRTPISSIKGYAETLLDGALDDKEHAQDFIKIIHGESGRLALLINDILDLSKIEADSFKLNINTTDVNNIINKAVSSLDNDLKKKKIVIESEIENCILEVEEGLMVQAVVNLIHNAIKYSNDNSKIIIRSKKQNDIIRIDVEDFGIGIPEKDISRIFERFYRVDKARSKEVGGTGLGLAIVKHIIQVHGGEVSVKSIEGSGSTFSFTIPLSC